MNNIKKFLIALTIFTLLPLTVNADCDSDFDTIKDQFKIAYKYNEDTDDFTMVMINPDNTRYELIYDNEEDIGNAKEQTDGTKTTITIPNHKGEEYDFSVFATYAGCEMYPLIVEELELKKYNPYADNPLCKGYEEFVLCQKDYDKMIFEDAFISRLETYKNTKTEEKENQKQNNEKKGSVIIDNTINFINDNIKIIIGAAVLLIILIITTIMLTKKIKKSRRLE